MPIPGVDTTHETFEQVCEKCSSKLEVIVPHQEGHEDTEEYYCPVCHAEYTVRASNTPEVNVLEKK